MSIDVEPPVTLDPTTSERPAEIVESEDEEGGTRIGDIYIPPPVPPYCSVEQKGPRLIIKKIENYNFKSYAGKVVLGPFHHCFTAIIGPNGSGKSNVIDSMLFVFGYRANKIRSNKISALLHNSARHGTVNKCSVAIHFREILDLPDGSCEELENTSIVIERTALRDNTSYYTVNGRKVQFKEVARLLKQYNVDLDHNRFLILQGEVESIAMMKPKGQTEGECGMLEYLEDIVGTTRYVEPLIKINARAESLAAERSEKHNRCKLAEREMKDLELPFNEAVEYLRHENENIRTKNLRIQKYLSEKKRKLEEYLNEQKVIEDELKSHDEKCSKLKEERAEKEKILQKETQQFKDWMREKEEKENLAVKLEAKYIEVQTLISNLNDTRKQNKTQITKNEKELEKLKSTPESNQKEIEECEKKIDQLNKQKEKQEEILKKNYEIIEKEMLPLIEKRDKLETTLTHAMDRVNQATSELSVPETELKMLKSEEVNQTRKYEALKSSYEDSRNELNEFVKKRNEFEARLPELEKEIKEKTSKVQKLRGKEKRLQEELRTLRNEINEKQSHMQEVYSNNKVLNFLMRLKNEGKIPGIFGRLGDLGAIDAMYDIAISTACGRLDNILVDTVDTAEECIENLKRFDIGRATFIALEKVNYLANHSQPIKTPENVFRLYDLVRVEDQTVLPAFYFALRDTLVAKDLDQGTRIAYGERRYRVVTLNGDIIESSGTMSGGGRTQSRGKMGTKVQTKTSNMTMDTSTENQKSLEEMQIKAQELQDLINFNQEEQGNTERELTEAQNSQIQIEFQLNKVMLAINRLEAHLPHALKQMEEQKKRANNVTTDPLKVKKLEATIKEHKEILEKAEKEAAKIKDEVTTIKNEIDSAHENRIKPIQTKLSNLNRDVNKLSMNKAKLQVEITNSERNIKKLETVINDLRKEIEDSQNKIREMAEVRGKYDDECTEVKQHILKLDETIKAAKKDSSGICKDIQDLQKKENDLNLKRLEIEQKLQTISAKASDVKSQIPHWQEQLKPLKLHEIPMDKTPQVPLKTYTEAELASYTLQDIQYKESVEEELLKKKPNLSFIAEYIKKRDIYMERVKILEDITFKRNEMRQMYDNVRKKRYNEFMQGFHIIARKLKEMYQMITQGGDAELELVDSMDPFTEGVTFSVRPAKKTWKNICNLSGGEKTLSSLALVFALHYYKPSPLYFMDEIDAALDFKNISIVAHYIKQRTKNAQFIIISLRSNMFELSDYLVGIYKVNDCTGSVCCKNQVPQLEGETQVTTITTDQNSGTTTIASTDITNRTEHQNEEPEKTLTDTAPAAEQLTLENADKEQQPTRDDDTIHGNCTEIEDCNKSISREYNNNLNTLTPPAR